MLKLKVTGMTCGHCEAAVKTALAEVPGVTAVIKVDREAGEAEVDGEARLDALLAAVREAGYDAEMA